MLYKVLVGNVYVKSYMYLEQGFTYMRHEIYRDPIGLALQIQFSLVLSMYVKGS